MVKYLLVFLVLFSFLFSSEPSKLVFSNQPESFINDGSLFEVEVTGSFRLFFSHCNKSGNNGIIYIEVIGNKVAGARIKDHFAGPNESELYVGKILGERFLQNEDASRHIKLPMQWEYTMKDLDVFSGIIDVFPDNINEPLKVKIYFNKESDVFIDKETCIFENKIISKRLKIDKDRIRYNLKIGVEEEYLNNGPYLLVGNYGVKHEFFLDFSELGTYQLLFTANGGPAASVFLLGDELFSDYSSSHKSIGEITVIRPGMKRFVTIPLPGSNYPTTVTIVKERVYTK